MPYRIVDTPIAELYTEAIVIPTNTELSNAASFGLEQRRVDSFRRLYTKLYQGDILVMHQPDLIQKHVFFAVQGKRSDDKDDLAYCYREILSRAIANEWRSISLPLFALSENTGLSEREIYRVAIREVKRALSKSDINILISVSDEKIVPVTKGLLDSLTTFIEQKLARRQKPGDYELASHALLFEPDNDVANPEKETESSQEDDLEVIARDYEAPQEYHCFSIPDTPKTEQKKKGKTQSSIPKEEIHEDRWAAFSIDHRDNELGYADAYRPSKPLSPSPYEELGGEDGELPFSGDEEPSGIEPNNPSVLETIRRKKLQQLEKQERRYAISTAGAFFDPKTNVLKTEESFSEALIKLIDEKGLTDPQCYNRANVSRAVFNKIKQSAIDPQKRSYKPSKSTALALAVALELTVDETNNLLKKAGLTLSPSDKGDVIVEYFLLNHMYDIFELNEVLFRFDQPLLGSF